MKNIYLTLLFLILANTINAKDTENLLKLKSIKNNIVASKFIYKLDGNFSYTKYSDLSGHQFTSNSDIIIKFFEKNIDIKYIESTYSLKFKRIMTSGDYIFINNSDVDTIRIIDLLLSDKNIKIKRLMPDFTMNMNSL